VLDARPVNQGHDYTGSIQLMPTEPRVSTLAPWLPHQGVSPLSGPIATSGSLAFGVAALTAPTAEAAGLGLERINPTVRWWENEELAELGWAIEEVFADPTPTGELVRPYIDQVIADRLWTGQGAVPPPTPVDGVSARGLTAPLPTRRQVRERRRAQTSTRAVAARRVAQGGVLAVTVFGVVAANAPHFGSSLRSGVASAAHNLVSGNGQDGATDTAADLSLAQNAVATDSSTSSTSPSTATDSSVGVPSVVSSPAPASIAVPTGGQPGESVIDALRQRIDKDLQDGQTVGNAASNAGGAIGLVAQAQAQAQAAQAAQVAQAAKSAKTAAAPQVRTPQTTSTSRDGLRGPKAIAQQLVADRGWSAAQFTCLDLLWTRESNWNYQATNPSSGAYGIPQALPGSKMGTVASDWRTNPVTQIKWGLNYIATVYGTPCGAWGHSQATGWY